MIYLLTLEGSTAVVQESLNSDLGDVLAFCTKYHINDRIRVNKNQIVFVDESDYLLISKYFTDGVPTQAANVMSIPGHDAIDLNKVTSITQYDKYDRYRINMGKLYIEVGRGHLPRSLALLRWQGLASILPTPSAFDLAVADSTGLFNDDMKKVADLVSGMQLMQ